MICRRPNLPKCRPCGGSLREALEALSADHEFLLKGDVFTKDQIEAYAGAEVGRGDAHRKTTPCPVEFDMYYSM